MQIVWSKLRSRLPVRRAGLTLAAGLLSVGLATSAAATGVGARRLHVAVSVPSVLAISGSKLWLANTGTGSLIEFNVSTGSEVRSIAGKKFQLYDSDAIAVADQRIWVANASSDTVTVIDASNGHLVALLKGSTDHFGSPIGLAVADHHVFVLGNLGNAVVEVEAATAHVVQVLGGYRDHFQHATALATVGDDVWILSTGGRGSLSEVAGTNGALVRVVSSRAAALDDPTALAPIGHDLWIANAGGGHLSLLDAATGRLLATPRVPHLDIDGVTSLVATNDGRLWVADTKSPSWVACLVTSTHDVKRILRHRFGFPTLFGGAGLVWAVDRTQSRVTEFNAADCAVVRTIVN